MRQSVCSWGQVLGGFLFLFCIFCYVKAWAGYFLFVCLFLLFCFLLQKVGWEGNLTGLILLVCVCACMCTCLCAYTHVNEPQEPISLGLFVL